MSLKAVEMQIALPRTMDAGKLQEQLQQRGQNMNDFAAGQAAREAEKKRTTVLKQEQKGNVKLFQDQKEQNQPSHNREQTGDKKKKDEMERKENHPYKGKRIDYSG